MKSVIKDKLLRKALFKGTVIALCGLSFIFFAAIKGVLSLLILSVGLILITIGLFPYKKLSKLQLEPHKLENDGEHLIFIKSGGKPLFKIDLKSIEKIEYVEKKGFYGLGVLLKRPLFEKIKVLQPRFQMKPFIYEGYDLFLPYFLTPTLDNIKGRLG